ncbi:MAG: HNH endonuclease [Peptoniphilus harei]|nr:HNH endonuclease [Peptoniphilus harei]
MEFKDFFYLLKPVLGDYKSNADLIRNLIDMITKPNDILESSFLKSDSTLKAYANGSRKFPPDFARSIIDNIDVENFIDSINSHPEIVLQALSDEYNKLPNTKKTNADDIATIIAEDFFNFLYSLASDNSKSIQNPPPSSIFLKHIYGNQLLIENKGICSYRNCGKPLFIQNNNCTSPYFEVVPIEPDEGYDIDNLIALCPECANKHLSSSDSDVDELLLAKMNQRDSLLATKKISDIPIEQEISEVLNALLNVTDDKLIPLSLEPVTVKNKLIGSPSIFIRKNLINVTQYFPFIEEQLKSLSREKRLNADMLSTQIRLAYITAKSGTNIKEEIYETLVEKIMRATNKTRDACEIVISYYIQKCEVFDDTTK